MMEKYKKVTFRTGGHIGNCMFSNTIDVETTSSKERIVEIQNDLYTWFDMVSEYVRDKLFDDELMKSMNVDLERFISDNNYYYHIYYNHKDTYKFIVDSFQKESRKYWESIFNYFFTDCEIPEDLIDISSHFIMKYHLEDIIENIDLKEWSKEHFKDNSIKNSFSKKERNGWKNDLTKELYNWSKN